jgi:hypothetical protein
MVIEKDDSVTTEERPKIAYSSPVLIEYGTVLRITQSASGSAADVLSGKQHSK